MSNYTSTEVYNYLTYLEHYINGDLEVFHKICEEAESVSPSPVTSSAGSMYAEPSQGSSPSTTTETTKYSSGEPSQFSALHENDRNIFRLTIPITLTLFATIDCVGYLSGNNNNPIRTNENFKEFFKQSTPPIAEADSTFLNQVFRQGLTHVYFPKLEVGISYHSKNPVGKLFFRDANRVLILNVNRLEEIVMNTFNSIKGNESLYPVMETRYQTLISNYQNDYETTIANYQT